MSTNTKTINTFNDIILSSENPLVLCDIDSTILYYDKDYYYFYDQLKKDFPYMDEKSLKEDAEYMHNMYIQFFNPKHTDFEGFKNMEQKIKELNGKIEFITARCKIGEKFTSKNFKDIGLNYDDYTVHYTDNKISKGEYIKKNIDITKYNEVIFIDDYLEYIQTVLNIFPTIKCYIFDHKMIKSI